MINLTMLSFFMIEMINLINAVFFHPELNPSLSTFPRFLVNIFIPSIQEQFRFHFYFNSNISSVFILKYIQSPRKEYL